MLFNSGRSAGAGVGPHAAGHRRHNFMLLVASVAALLGACSFGASPGNTPTPAPTATSQPQTPGLNTPVATGGPVTSLTPAPGGTATPEAQVSPTVTGRQTKVDRTKPAAVVNGEPITFEELDGELEERYGARTLDGMIMARLITQEARKKNATVSDGEVKAEIAQVQKNFPGQTLDQIAAQVGLASGAELREQARLRLLVEKILAPETAVTDQEAQAYYNNNQLQFADPPQFNVLRVVTDTQAEANAAAQELKAGAKIETVIEKHGSKTPSRAQLNGAPGFVRQEQLGTELGNAVRELPLNGVSAPVKLAGGGFGVIKLLEQRGGTPPPFEKIKPRVLEVAREQKLNERAPVFLDELRKRAKIDSQLDLQPAP